MAAIEARARSRERVSATANDILATFESGELPHALAQLFIHRKIEVPSRLWTWTNRLIALRRSHVYAAGFRQWQEIGRSVRKGEHAFHILAPRVLVAKEDNEDEGIRRGDRLTVGFLPVPVFGYFQTEGDPLPGAEDAPEFIDRLPLVEVARSWGLMVALHSCEDSPGRLGYLLADTYLWGAPREILGGSAAAPDAAARGSAMVKAAPPSGLGFRLRFIRRGPPRGCA